MPLYKQSSLRKYPWLWRYDVRRKGMDCHRVGHRYRWFRIKKSTDQTFFGLCYRCDKVRLLTLKLDQFGDVVDIRKQYLITQVKTITQAEAKLLLIGREVETIKTEVSLSKPDSSPRELADS